MVQRHPASAFWQHFPPWITKKMDLETVSHFDIPNHRKSRNCAQSGSQEASKIYLKSIKIDIWLSVCPLGIPLDAMITKMVPQVPKIQPEDLQNNNLKYKTTPISVATQPAAPCIQGGRRQGRSLKILLDHSSII